MTTHSSTLAWRIPWTEKPGGLQSTGLQRVGHDWRDDNGSQNITLIFLVSLLLFSRSTLCDPRLQHARLPCPSPSPGACSNSCPLHWWCHPTISSSVDPFSFCLRSFPASGSFLMSQFCASGGQSTGLQLQHHSSNEYSGLISFRIDWLDLLAVQGTLKCLLQHHSSKASILRHLSLLYSPTLTSMHDYWKNHSLD